MNEEPEFEDFSGNAEKVRGALTLAALIGGGAALAVLMNPLVGVVAVLAATPILRRVTRSQLVAPVEPGPRGEACEKCGGLQSEVRGVAETSQVEFVCNSCGHTWGRRRSSGIAV